MAESKKQKTALNIAMAIVAAIIVVAGIAFVTNMKGQAPSQGAAIAAQGKVGSVSVERAGISYALDEGSKLQAGDKVSVSDSSTVELVSQDSSLALDASAVLTVGEGEGLSVRLESGEVFACAGSEAIEVKTSQQDFKVANALADVSARKGSSSLQVLAGEVTLQDAKTLSQEKEAAFLASGEASGKQLALKASSLSDFCIDCAVQAIAEGHDCCFDADELAKVQKKRSASKEASSAKAKVQTEKAEQSEKTHKAQGASSGAEGSSSSSLAGEGKAGKKTSTGGQESKSSSSSNKAEAKTATIEIRCKTVLSNLDKLAEGKAKFVPKNGLLLSKTTVKIADGDTVFDVLKAVCSQENIQLEYSVSPAFNSTYIEGIGNLYEKDCGDESGWVYTVNAWSPNYACSEYKVKAGDTIVFSYSCSGYGADCK